MAKGSQEADQAATAAAAKSLQSCLTLCDPIDSSPSGSSVPGILQARTLEWVAISFSNARKGKVKVKSLSRVRLLATPWTAAHQAPPSMGFCRQEYWSEVPLPSPDQAAKRPALHNNDQIGLATLVPQTNLPETPSYTEGGTLKAKSEGFQENHMRWFQKEGVLFLPGN